MDIHGLNNLLADLPKNYQIVLSQFISKPIDWKNISQEEKDAYIKLGVEEGKDQYFYIVRDFPTCGVAVNHENKEVRIALSVSDITAIAAVHPNSYKPFKPVNNNNNQQRRHKHRNNNHRKNA